MVEQAWEDAARAYRAMGEAERAAYWSRLGSEQRRLLDRALAELDGAVRLAEEPVHRRPGCLRLGFIGCGGMILGVVLVIAAQIAMIGAGLSMIKGAVSPASGGSARQDRPFETFMEEHPIISDPDPMPEFCKNEMFAADADERFACTQWAERHSKGGSWGE